MSRLITTPVSHYCEKARWALQLAGIPFEEDGWPPAIHRLALLRRGAITAPVLVLDDGRVLRGSTTIVRHADAEAGLGLFPDGAAELVARFDARLGPAARLLAYSTVLEDPEGFEQVLGSGLTPGRRRALALGRRAVMGTVQRVLGVDERGVRRSTAIAEEDLAFARRTRGECRYLVGDRFSAADLTFAALGAPLVWPDEYGAPIPRAAELPRRSREAIARWRSVAGSEVILTLYSSHRVVPRAACDAGLERHV